MSGEVKFVKVPGAWFSLPAILAFDSEKSFISAKLDEGVLLNMDGADRVNVLKAVWKEAKRMEKADKKAEKTTEKEPEQEQ